MSASGRANRAAPGPGLGRGLDALLPGERAEESARELPLDAIEPNPRQPRKSFDEKEAAQLAQSIGEHGILQPLLVRRIGADRYQLVAGERRWRAARQAGLEQVPVVLTDAPDGEMLTLALVENLQREGLNPIDQAGAFQYLLDAGLTQEEVARQVGKSRAAVANAVRLLQLPSELRELVVEGQLGEGHARALLAAPASNWPGLAKAIVGRGLSVREVEQEARRLQKAGESDDSEEAPEGGQIAPGVDAASWEEWRREASERLQRALGTRASVSQDGAKGGRIVLRWYTFEQLEQLVHQLSTSSGGQSSDGESDRSKGGDAERVTI